MLPDSLIIRLFWTTCCLSIMPHNIHCHPWSNLITQWVFRNYIRNELFILRQSGVFISIPLFLVNLHWDFLHLNSSYSCCIAFFYKNFSSNYKKTSGSDVTFISFVVTLFFLKKTFWKMKVNCISPENMVFGLLVLSQLFFVLKDLQLYRLFSWAKLGFLSSLFSTFFLLK